MLLVIEKVTVEHRNRADPDAGPTTQFSYAPFGIFEDESQFILPPGEFAILEAGEFDKHGFPKSFKQRTKHPRLKVTPSVPQPPTIEPLK